MEDRKLLIDTSILIDFLRKEKKEKSLLWNLKEESGSLAISSISVFELYAGATNAQKRIDVETLLKWFEIIEFDEEIAQIAGEIFQQLKKTNRAIDYRDLFIGASAIFYNLNLVTLNIKHFEKIPNLEIILLQ